MMRIEDVIKAAQQYDLENRPSFGWQRVPDSQVARLLEGARLAREKYRNIDQRRATVTEGG